MHLLLIFAMILIIGRLAVLSAVIPQTVEHCPANCSCLSTIASDDIEKWRRRRQTWRSPARGEGKYRTRRRLSRWSSTTFSTRVRTLRRWALQVRCWTACGPLVYFGWRCCVVWRSDVTSYWRRCRKTVFEKWRTSQASAWATIRYERLQTTCLPDCSNRNDRSR